MPRSTNVVAIKIAVFNQFIVGSRDAHVRLGLQCSQLGVPAVEQATPDATGIGTGCETKEPVEWPLLLTRFRCRSRG